MTLLGGGECFAAMDTVPTCIEGYATGTRKARRSYLVENAKERLAERAGFEVRSRIDNAEVIQNAARTKRSGLPKFSSHTRISHAPAMDPTWLSGITVNKSISKQLLLS